jgi:formylglycine-generating enzyme required for sulfatase activity
LNGPNQPVVGVSFFEAEACCAWAGGRLPQEQEWEAAARGSHGCEYPWCGKWKDGICNTWEAGLGVTSPVGLFPRSRQTQLGIEDLAGNVWEWCATVYDDPDDAAPARGSTRPRVVRGGSWRFSRDLARCADRGWFNPVSRYDYVGFRVVCSSPSKVTDL